MRFAVDKDQNRISIADAVSTGSYFCPFCGEEMIQRKGRIRKWHFSHKFAQCGESIKYEAAEALAEDIEVVEESPGEKLATLVELWNQCLPVVMIVQNSETGRKVRIHDDPNVTTAKYKRCYGYISDKTGKFIKGYKTIEIYGWNKPVWRLLWFKTEEDNRIKERNEAIMRLK